MEASRDKLVNKIRKLLSLANDQANSNEAASAKSIADRLIEEHAVRPEELEDQYSLALPSQVVILDRPLSFVERWELDWAQVGGCSVHVRYLLLESENHGTAYF